MNILEDFYDRLQHVVEDRKLSSKRLEKCYNSYKESLEIGELFTEEYTYNYKDVKNVVKKNETLYINPSTRLVFKKFEPHPMFQKAMFVCIGIDKNDEFNNLTMTEVLICQNNKWFFNISSCVGSSSEIPEDFYALKL